MEREAFNVESNDDQFRVILDFLVEVRDGASQKMMRY